jgi:hypothetical protein
MNKIDVIGKSREVIEKETRNLHRSDLLDLIYQLATWEPKFKPATIAAACQMTPRAIVQRIKSGEIRGAHKPLENGWRVSLSGLREWDEQTALRLTNGH